MTFVSGYNILEKARAAGADINEAERRWEAEIPKLINAAITVPVLKIKF